MGFRAGAVTRPSGNVTTDVTGGRDNRLSPSVSVTTGCQVWSGGQTCGPVHCPQAAQPAHSMQNWRGTREHEQIGL